MSDFTPQQERAIHDHDRNLVVVAGAGSGKTRVLVERYLALLEANPDWSLTMIVAVTFTREAALEMRNRVRSSLEQRLRESRIPEQRNRWSQLLAEMDSARIDTIHGLCATILRANAAQAGIDPAFAVLEAADQKSMTDDLIASVLRSAAGEDDPAVQAVLQTYEHAKIVKTLLASATLTIPLPSPLLSSEDVLERGYQLHHASHSEEIDRLRHELDALLYWEPEGGFPVASDDKLMDVWRQVHALRPALSDPEQFFDALSALAGSKKGGNIGFKDVWGAEQLRESRETLKALQELAINLKTLVWNQSVESEYAVMTAGWYRLIDATQSSYRAAKQQASALDFDDLERMTAALLIAHPEVAARYQGAAIRALLVDEFQDTNENQWQIVQALTAHERRPALFVVGDPKQSIYGFRGADVAVFNRVREQLGQSSSGAALSLSLSFRSHPALVDIFNHLFSTIMAPPDGETSPDTVGYDAMQAFRPELPVEVLEHYAPLELLLLRSKDNGSNTIHADKRRVWEADEIAERIQKMVVNEAPIFERQEQARPCNYGDIAILFRRMSSVTVYEQALRSHNIPYVTVSGRGYYDRQEIYDVMNLLQALYNPADALALTGALRSPFFGFSDDLLLALRLSQPDKHLRLWLWNALDTLPDDLSQGERERLQFARAVLYDLRQIAGRVTISELLQQAFTRTGYLATLQALPGGARMRANVEKLLNLAISSGRITLSRFTQYVESVSTAEVREGEAPLEATNVVKLMTIHASKGLEFPVVILADTSASGGGNSAHELAVLYDEELQMLVCRPPGSDWHASFHYRRFDTRKKLREEGEALRLLYVAATRAQDCLIVSGTLSYTKGNGWHSKELFGKLLDALNLPLDQEQPVSGRLEIAGSRTIRYEIPDYHPDEINSRLHRDVTYNWPDLAAVDVPQAPALLGAVNTGRDRWIGHLAATQLANLGGLYHAREEYEKQYYRNNLRRQIFDDSSVQPRYAVPQGEPRVRRRQIGEVVHEALRYWRFETEPAHLERLLRGYAWQNGITGEQDVAYVVRKAREVLRQFQESDIYHEINTVRQAGLPFYAELPFIYRTDRRVIHGVIDLLYQRPDGSWLVLDYKTSIVRTADKRVPSFADVNQHAQRYYLQVGAYAAAAELELGGITPEAAIYYISYNQFVPVPESAWKSEIRQLERYIGEMLNDVETSAG